MIKKLTPFYIKLSGLKPDGAIKVAKEINVDVTADGKMVGIELLDATNKITIDSLLTYEIEAEALKN